MAIGDTFGPVTYEVSAAANDRYWRGAGIEHPARAAGVLYPPMAANLTILALQTVVTVPMLHTAQRLVSHRLGHGDTTLTVTGAVTDRFERRGRQYLEATASVTLPDGSKLWTSIATFIPAGMKGAA